MTPAVFNKTSGINMLLQRSFKALAFGLGFLAAASSTLAASYQFVPLGGPVGGISAQAINASGVVAGSAGDPVGYAQRASTWSGGQLTLLERQNSSGSSAWAINDRGQVAGYAWDNSTGQTAAVWSKGTKTLLAREQGTTSQFATGINNASLVVGNRSMDFDWTTQAVTWLNYDVTPLEMLGATSSYATGVNDLGQISGYLMYGDKFSARYQAVVWQGGDAMPLLSLTGSPDACCTRAHAISDTGFIVGDSFGDGMSRAVYWQGSGNATELDAPGSGARAQGVNNLGQAVGVAFLEGREAAMLWDLKTGHYIDLNTFLTPEEVAAGWSLTSAYGINDSGDIVGTAFNRKMASFKPFALMSAVPEPSSWLLGLLGVMGMAARRQRRVAFSA